MDVLAKFEAEHGSADSAAAVDRRPFRGTGQREERALVLDAWYEREHASGDADRLAVVNARMPKRTGASGLCSRRTESMSGTRTATSFLPRGSAGKGSLKILEAARVEKQKAAP